MTRLKGITWGHSRGFTPLVACSQAWNDLHPSMDIEWHKRSLWTFGEGPLDELAKYDLLVVDHPFCGRAAETGLILPFDEFLLSGHLAELEAGSVGPSFRSYRFENRMWALPIDAAAQVSAARSDLLAKRRISMPRTWAEVMALAKRHGGVTAPLSPINALSCFLTLCAHSGSPVQWSPDGVAFRPDVADAVLERLRTIAAMAGPESLNATPIDVLNRMSSGDDLLYVPLCFGYTNYCRAGFAPHRLTFADIPCDGTDEPHGSCLGGAGIAVNRQTAHRCEAIAFARWVAGKECQSTLYVAAGGQPAHAASWDDGEANRITGGFFTNTRRTLELAYLRPNFPKFPAMQERAMHLIHEHLRGQIETGALLDRLRSLA